MRPTAALGKLTFLLRSRCSQSLLLRVFGNAGARFYVDLARDHLFHALKQAYTGHARWRELEAHYAAGRYGAAAKVAVAVRAEAPAKSPLRFGAFTRRIPIRVDDIDPPAGKEIGSSGNCAPMDGCRGRPPKAKAGRARRVDRPDPRSPWALMRAGPQE